MPNTLGRTLTEDETLAHVRDVEGWLAGAERVSRRVMEGAPRLRAVARIGVGLDTVDLEAAEAHGIAISRTPDAPTDAVAEMTLAALLAIMRRLVPMSRELAAGRWTRELGSGVAGKTVLVIGYGRIGRRTAALFGALGMRVLICDPAIEGSTPLEQGLREADVISLHAPGGAAILDAAAFARMRDGVVVLNGARGDLIDEDALTDALDTGRVGACWLDVFRVEPYRGPLARHPRVLATPHAATFTRECRVRMELEAVENLLRDLATHPAARVSTGRARAAVLFVVAVVCLGLALRGADLAASGRALAGFAWWRMPVVMALYGVSLLVRTERYRRLLRTPVAFGPMLGCTSASYLAINVVPFRMGELVRPYLLRAHGVPWAESIAAVVAERLLDMVAMVVLVSSAVWLFDGPSVVISGIDLLSAVRHTMLVGIACVLGVVAAFRIAGRRLPVRVPVLARVDEGITSVLARRRETPIVLVCTAISWLATTGACGIALAGLGDALPTLGTTLFVWAAILSAIVLVPTPGFVGGFEVATVAAFAVLHRDADVARAFALILHSAQIGFAVIVGLVGFTVIGASPVEAVRESQKLR